MNYEVICVPDTDIEIPEAKVTMFITYTANVRSFLTIGEVSDSEPEQRLTKTCVS